MASATISLTTQTPSLVEEDGARYIDGFLSTTKNIVQDYSSTKIGGTTDILSSQADTKVPFGDWRDDFFKDGYHVIRGAIPRERADAYRERALDWFAKFDFGFDINNRDTWIQEYLPMMMKGGVILNYCAAHEKWVWEART